ncbi:hypothetical protein GCM10011576_45490 [Micromonospora parathelypteridis]|nr:hypothetical protein GCM10011576_45490 [Micromonospora parathelypteridis]
MQIVQQASGQVIDDHDLAHLWGLVQRPHQVGANEAGTPGHHYLQRVSLLGSAPERAGGVEPTRRHSGSDRDGRQWDNERWSRRSRDRATPG